MTRPAYVRVALRDLRIAEEFVSSCRHEPGRVISWGFVLDQDERTGRVMRVRAVLVRYGLVERIHSAEMLVLVPFDRPHARHEADELRRWGTELRQPFTSKHVAEREARIHLTDRVLAMAERGRKETLC